MTETARTFRLAATPVERTDEVTAAWLEEFAAATTPAGASAVADDLIERMFLMLPPYLAVGDAVAAAFPPEVVDRSVAYATELTFHEPAKDRETVVSRAEVIGVRHQRVGSSVLFGAQTRSARTGIAVSGAQIALRLRSDCPAGGEFGDTLDTTRVELQSDVLALDLPTTPEHAASFARAAREPAASIHTDAALARAIGLPGPILQGLCMLAMAGCALTTRLAARPGGKPIRIAARYLASAEPGETLNLRANRADDGGAHAFVVANSRGTVLDGTLTLSSA